MGKLAAGKFDESSMIHQTKTIQINYYLHLITFWLVYSFARLIAKARDEYLAKRFSQYSISPLALVLYAFSTHVTVILVLFQTKDKMGHLLKIIQYSDEEPVPSEYREQGVINWDEFLNFGSVRIKTCIIFSSRI